MESPPHTQPLGTGVIALSAGDQHACALLNGGAVECWGLNSNGQLGTGDSTNRLTPTAVVGLGSGGEKCVIHSPSERNNKHIIISIHTPCSRA